MLRARTVREQILPILGYARENVARGFRVVEACQTAISTRQHELGMRYQTLVDGLRRRLGLSDIRELHRLVEAWIHAGSSDLKDLLLRQSESAAHADIEDFFKKFRAEVYDRPSEPVRPAGLSEATAALGAGAGANAGRRMIAMDRLDPKDLAALRERARMNRRSLDDEVRAILTQAARLGRSDLSTWAAGLRSRLRNRYTGDVTAEIRADRER